MRHASAFAASLSSPRWLKILPLAALLAVLGAAQCLAQAPAAVATPATAVHAVAPAPVPAGDFLGALAAEPADFLAASSSCTNNAQCPPGKLCCRACGFFGCTAMACLTPMNGHCPLIP